VSVRNLPSVPPTPADHDTKQIGYGEIPRKPRVRHLMRSGELTAGGQHVHDHSNRTRYNAGGKQRI